jgi:hypothetical protein
MYVEGGTSDSLSVITDATDDTPGVVSIMTSTGTVVATYNVTTIGKPVSALWPPSSSWLAVTNYHGVSAFTDSTTGDQVKIRRGWNAVCWKPDGIAVLVTDGHTLALVKPSTPNTVTTVGTFNRGTVYGAVWPKPAH